MNVLVTGGAGSVGTWVVKRLAEQGHAVTVAGRSEHKDVEGMARYVSLDVTDAQACREVVDGHQRVIHLAAIPSPGGVPGAQLFNINCDGTYNLLEACVMCGVDHVAVASSINALGQKYGVKPWPVHYFPIDEDHPQLHSDPYSLSKHVTEEIARYFWHKNGLSSISLRIPAVMAPGPWSADWLKRERESMGNHFASDFWVMIDSRDSAAAFDLASQPIYQGAHICFVNDTVNVVGVPSRELAARWYGYVTDWRAPMEADEAMVSPDRFRALTGWEPQYSWRGVLDGAPMP